MRESSKIILIPAYQPEEVLIGLVKQLKEEKFYIIVVNDGSGTEYEEIFRKTSEYADVLEYGQNKGKGEALKTGLSYIRERFEEPYVVVTADADGQHRPEDIIKVSEEAKKSPYSLVLGSRHFEGKVPLRSNFGNTMTRLVYRLFTGVSVHDTQTGLRGFSHRLIRNMLEIPGSRYEYEMNVLMDFAREKIEIKEIPIETIYLGKNETSHFHVLRDSYRIYKEILKFSCASFISFLLDYLLFCLASALTGTLVFSNIFARVLSATFNFKVNQKLVFHAKGNEMKEAVKYAELAVFILICNTLILKGLAMTGLNIYLGKIITETVLFFFVIQHSFVFRKAGAAA